MDNFELHQEAMRLADRHSAYELARIVIELREKHKKKEHRLYQYMAEKMPSPGEERANIMLHMAEGVSQLVEDWNWRSGRPSRVNMKKYAEDRKKDARDYYADYLESKKDAQGCFEDTNQ